MSDENALLNAIAANPVDSTVRLVYADWLEENGRTDEAEYLRIETEVVKDLDSQTNSSLRNRLSQLIPLTSKEWRECAAFRFDLILEESGPEKIKVIKVLREITGLGLKETLDLFYRRPIVVQGNLMWETVNSDRDRLESVGATARIALAQEPVLGPSQLETDELHYLVLTMCGSNKIQVIQVIREVTGLSLKEAKEMADNAPCVLSENPSATLLSDYARRFDPIQGCVVSVVDNRPAFA